MRKDIFPATPEGFHFRVEATLSGLEDKKMENIRIHRIRWIAIAAVLLLLTLGVAAALVQSNVLRTKMNDAGVEALSAQVQEVHVTDTEKGFSFTIEEVLREGEKLLVSYTASVPEDGKTYLFSPYRLMLNDRRISCDMTLDTEFFSTMYALGGEYGSSVTQIMQLSLDNRTLGVEQNLFSCQCVFMEALRPLEKKDAQDFHALVTEPDMNGIENQLMQNADTLYYFDTSVAGDPVPVVYLFHYPELRHVFAEKTENVLDVFDLERTGIAKHAATCEAVLPIGGLEREVPQLNDVTQRVYFMDGYSVEIRELSISHFTAGFKMIIRREDGAFEGWSEEEPFGRYYELCNPDGTDFGTVDYYLGSADVLELEAGERVYCVEGSYGGVFPIDGLNEICLAPAACDENDIFTHRDMDRAIRLMPFSNSGHADSEPKQTPDPAETDELSS